MLSRAALFLSLTTSITGPALAVQPPPAAQPPAPQGQLSGELHPNFAPNLTFQQSPPGFRTPDNAALLYFQALLKLDRVKAGTIKPDGAPADWTPDAAGVAVLDEQATVIAGLVRASQISNCDWGYEYGQGWTLELPHFSALRAATRLLDADVRRSITAKAPPDDVAARLSAMLRMADHTSREPVLIGCLVATAMTNLAADTTDHALARSALDGPGRDKVLAAARSLLTDDPMNYRAALQNEQRISHASIEAMLAGGDSTLANGLRFMFASDPALDKNGTPTGDAAKDALGKLDASYEAMLSAWSAPDAKEQFQKLIDKVDHGQFGPFAKLLLPAINKAHESAEKTKARIQRLIKTLEQYTPPPSAPPITPLTPK